MRRSALALLLLGSIGCDDGSREGAASAAPAAGAAGLVPPPRARPVAPELRGAARALEEGNLELARELARAHLETHPQDGQAMYLLGLVHYSTGNHGAARPWLEQVLLLEPELYTVHELLGHSLFLLGELAGARREYEEFLAIVPREPRGHYGLGLIELEETRLAAAAERFRRAIELYGELHGELQQPGRGDPRQTAARRPELAECHARLGEVHFARGEYEAARAELLRATSLCPENISAFYTLSLVHRRLGAEELADQAAARYESARQALLARQGKHE